MWDNEALKGNGKMQPLDALRAYHSGEIMPKYHSMWPTRKWVVGHIAARASDFQSVATPARSMAWPPAERQTAPGGSSTRTRIVKPAETV